MHRGPNWKLSWSSWCPCPSVEGGRSLLGLLAVVCGDGSCVVMMLPREISTTRELGTTATSSTASPSIATSVVPVVTEETVRKWVVHVGGHNSGDHHSSSPHSNVPSSSEEEDGANTPLNRRLQVVATLALNYPPLPPFDMNPSPKYSLTLLSPLCNI